MLQFSYNWCFFINSSLFSFAAVKWSQPTLSGEYRRPSRRWSSKHCRWMWWCCYTTSCFNFFLFFPFFQGFVPFFVSATAGTTVYGAFDPLIAISDICKKYNVWMHVDVSDTCTTPHIHRNTELTSEFDKSVVSVWPLTACGVTQIGASHFLSNTGD